MGSARFVSSARMMLSPVKGTEAEEALETGSLQLRQDKCCVTVTQEESNHLEMVCEVNWLLYFI